MAYIATSEGETHRLEVFEVQDALRVRLDEREFPLDFQPVGSHLYSLLIGGRSFEVGIFEVEGALMVLVGGNPFRVEVRRDQNAPGPAVGKRQVAPVGKEMVTAPLPGKVTRILVSVGQRVQPGDGIVVLEAMKMENELKASFRGTVTSVRVGAGQLVTGGDVLVVIE